MGTLCNDASIEMNIYVCKDIHAEFTVDNCLKYWYVFGFGLEWRDLNNAYFMMLFFFISGIFTPSSLDRKGAYDFIRDRVKRLGLPALVYYLLLGPLLYYLSYQMMGARISYGQGGNWIHGGPPWFVIILLCFNVMIGACLGAAESLAGGQSFYFFPNGVGQLVGSTFFFTAGILAKRNNWLEEFEQWSMTKIWFLRILSLCGIGMCFLSNILQWLHYQKLPGLQAGIVYGIWKVAVSLTLIDLFRRRFNEGGALTKFASDAAYTVYLIHPYIVTLAVWSYPVILKACGLTVEKAWTEPPLNGITHEGVNMAFLVESQSEVVLWLGFFYIVIAANLVLWPLAWLLRQLPVLKDVIG